MLQLNFLAVNPNIDDEKEKTERRARQIDIGDVLLPIFIFVEKEKGKNNERFLSARPPLHIHHARHTQRKREIENMRVSV